MTIKLTPRQKLINALTLKLIVMDIKYHQYPNGEPFKSLNGNTYSVKCPPVPEYNSHEMTDIVECVARRYKDTWKYYLSITDKQYYILVKEALKKVRI